MIKLRGLVLKNGQLERVPSLPPVDRVASLVDDECKLTPLSTSFWDMDPPTGVFTRAYEDLYYLDVILCKAASANMAKEFMERPQLEDLAKGYSVLDEAERQRQQHDDMMRGALGKVGFEEYKIQNSGLYSGLGLGGGHTILDEIERQNVFGLGASNTVQEEVERLQSESGNSLGFSSVGSAFEEMECLRTEADSRLGFSVAGSAFDEMERLRTESGNSFLGLGSAGSDLEETERQREELVNSTRTKDALLGHGIHDSLETHQNPIPDAAPTTVLPLPIGNHSFKYMQEENKRLQEEREKQRLRDERQERQARNSDALLRAQAENDQKAEVDRRFSKRAQVLGLIIAAIGTIGSFISVI